MKELNKCELVEVYGGSEESYNAGYKLGSNLRNAIDGVAVISFLVFVASRGRVKL
ncbi:hypothetical protein [Limibacterium fermenti]|jgi:hypothetical protein|uniref:hypothetical protein n=1 Tax=Limibacterium fermenti TaxID=3229863 RepID=UPI00268F0A05